MGECGASCCAGDWGGEGYLNAWKSAHHALCTPRDKGKTGAIRDMAKRYFLGKELNGKDPWGQVTFTEQVRPLALTISRLLATPLRVISPLSFFLHSSAFTPPAFVHSYLGYFVHA